MKGFCALIRKVASLVAFGKVVLLKKDGGKQQVLHQSQPCSKAQQQRLSEKLF
jgi:hypothetical protein